MILMIHFDEAEFGLGCASLFQREAVNSFEATIVAASPLLISSLLEQFSRWRQSLSGWAKMNSSFFKKCQLFFSN